MLVTLEKQIPKIESIYKRLGASGASRRSKSICIKLDKISEILPSYIEPSLTYSRWRVETGSGCVRFENAIELRSPKLAMIMNKSTQACCFVATLGSRIDREIKRLMKENRLSEAYLLDTAGSLAIEEAVEQFCNNIYKEVQQKGMTITVRFSPGYCDCPINEQQKLFRLVSADQIGVSLSETFLMQPRKTISGVFGIIPPANMKDYSPYIPCRDCSRQNCAGRRMSN